MQPDGRYFPMTPVFLAEMIFILILLSPLLLWGVLVLRLRQLKRLEKGSDEWRRVRTLAWLAGVTAAVYTLLLAALVIGLSVGIANM